MATIKTWIENDRGRFRVRFRDPLGRARDIWPISRWDTRSEARQAATEWLENQRGKALGKSDPQTSLRILFDRWILDCRAGIANKKGKIIAESTIGTFANSLKYVLENIRVVSELNNEWVKDYVRFLNRTYTGWTPHRRLIDLKSFCSYLRRQKLMNWDPFEDISISQPNTRPRFYSDEELIALESAAMALNSRSSLLLLRLGYLCGLRHGEVSRLSAEDFRKDSEMPGWGLLTIWQDESKNRTSREVPVPPKVMELIPRKKGKLFADWNKDHFEYWWARLLAKAGLEPAGRFAGKYGWAKVEKTERKSSPYHGLRHSYCRRMLENGADINDLKNWTGHKSVKVLIDTYGHVAKKHQRNKARECYERAESKAELAGQMRGKLGQNNGILINLKGHGETVLEGKTGSNAS